MRNMILGVSLRINRKDVDSSSLERVPLRSGSLIHESVPHTRSQRTLRISRDAIILLPAPSTAGIMHTPIRLSSINVTINMNSR